MSRAVRPSFPCVCAQPLLVDVLAGDSYDGDAFSTGVRLPYPVDEIQGPVGSIPIWKSWLYAFYTSSALVTGVITFDITPREPGLAVYTLIVVYCSLFLHVIVVSTANSDT